MKLAAFLMALFTAAHPAPSRAAEPDQAAPQIPTVPIIKEAPPAKDPDVIDGRKRPGRETQYPPAIEQTNPGAVPAPPPEAFSPEQIGIRDRWRLSAALGLVKPHAYDPYNQNTLKGDRPLKGTEDWFLELSGISDTVIEPRSFPTPISAQSTQNPGSYDAFGRTNLFLLSQTFIASASLIKGSTAFKPPEWDFTATLAFNINYATAPERQILSVNPSKNLERTDGFVGVQDLFVERHLRNVSTRYDFDAVRVGIQPFISDFRGFLFQDNPLGVRFFGNRDGNRVQYNLAFFVRLTKDTNSGLNDLTKPIRNDYVVVGNLYRQDFPVPGFTSQITAIYNANREASNFDFNKNGIPVIPAIIGNDKARDYDVVYLGYNGDGHFGRLNLTASAYLALGQDRNNIFTGKPADIRAYFFAAEPSVDFDWVRVRLSGLYASGNHNPHGNTETGFDAILENPQFAGADTSYFIRESVPFIGGGLVGLTGPNGVLMDLRSSKDEGQSNFNNPGTALLGIGADFDVLPQLRLTTNINHIWFADTAVIKALRQQGNVSHDLGWDYSLAATWRPRMTQNVVFRLSGAIFSPDTGFNNLFTSVGHDSVFYSVLFNTVLSF